MNYYDREIKKDDENQTVGILLSTNKNETVVKYTDEEKNFLKEVAKMNNALSKYFYDCNNEFNELVSKFDEDTDFYIAHKKMSQGEYCDQELSAGNSKASG